MGRVPITVMGYRCERCGHEWIPRSNNGEEPRVCPKCRSPWWNKPKKNMMPYDAFKTKIVEVLREMDSPITWTEIRTRAGLPQRFPNNQWVHRLEKDIGLHRERDQNGIITWQLKEKMKNAETAKTSNSPRARTDRK
jgi:predicted Zn-ribbon and HTH transcriptional regulator